VWDDADSVVVAVGEQAGYLVYSTGEGDRQSAPSVQMAVVR